MPRFQHHEAEAREGEAAGRQVHATRSEAIKREDGDGEQHGDAQQCATEEGQVVLFRVEGGTLPQTDAGQRHFGRLEGDCRRFARRQREGIGALPHHRKDVDPRQTSGDDADNPASGTFQRPEARAREAALGNSNDDVARRGRGVTEAYRNPAEPGARPLGLKRHEIADPIGAIGALDGNLALVELLARHIGLEIDHRQIAGDVSGLNGMGGVERKDQSHEQHQRNTDQARHAPHPLSIQSHMLR